MKKKAILHYIILSLLIGLAGTSMHFAHHLEVGDGLRDFFCHIFPIGETCWEHMKMIFFPLLLLAVIMCIKQGCWRSDAVCNHPNRHRALLPVPYHCARSRAYRRCDCLLGGDVLCRLGSAETGQVRRHTASVAAVDCCRHPLGGGLLCANLPSSRLGFVPCAGRLAVHRPRRSRPLAPPL